MSAVAILPTAPAIDAAWQRYVTLETESDRDPALRVDLQHNIAKVRAWAAWRDLFLASDRRS